MPDFFGVIAAVVSVAEYLVFQDVSFLLAGLLAANIGRAYSSAVLGKRRKLYCNNEEY
ncbi:hypothetical protein [Weizmannia acidilactici]|uniref:hypothetical protein n=1 Tax=Weizmannia acidilactici TaxID=2607726 RepID=UPI001561BE0A|nr:hypothetical protein [Weizmannia acidilactici]